MDNNHDYYTLYLCMKAQLKNYLYIQILHKIGLRYFNK